MKASSPKELLSHSIIQCRTPKVSWNQEGGISLMLTRVTRRMKWKRNPNSNRGMSIDTKCAWIRLTIFVLVYSDDAAAEESEDFDSSDDESVVESDEDDFEPEDEEEEEGLDWDELEMQARKEDRERGNNSDEEDRSRKKRRH